jgi:hypothetical protein
MMRAFLTACLAVIILGASGYLFLGAIQDPAGFAFLSEAARITPNWAWRSVGYSTVPAINTAAENVCVTPKAWQWIFVDFGGLYGQPAICSISQ